MPATEETYRSQPALHIVFALTSIAMLLSIVWMILADHLRPWKEVQREFQKIEEAKLEATRREKVKDQNAARITGLTEKIAAADASAAQHGGALRKLDAKMKTLGGEFEGLDTKKRFKKAELDSKRSEYDLLIDRDLEREANSFLRTVIRPMEEEYDALSKKYEKSVQELDAVKAQRDELLGHVDDLKKEREKLTREADRVARAIEQKDALYGGSQHWYSKPMAFVRGLPGIDLMPPTKIQQISLPELTINYNFKDVPRYDRCTTCHQGIDRLGYDTTPDGKTPMKDRHPAFAAHPHLSDGATTIDPSGKVVTAGLYLDANGPHPINSFGCTICHGGQGSGTDFTYSSHEPDDLEEREKWEHKHGWREMHHWDEPMLPTRFLESSCVKCHHEVTDVPQAKKLQAGYERITKYGCTGCHTIGGEGSFGPDLTDEPQVGPNLAHVASKVSKEWILKWIKNPHAFRPDSRMPRFYGVTNNNEPKDWPKNHAEIHAIATYLFARSTPAPGFSAAPPKGDRGQGKALFLQKGCMACHSHRPYTASEVQPRDKNDINPKSKPDAAETYDPGQFPENVRQYAQASFGPNLANIAAKFTNHDDGQKWLAHWIQTPEAYHPKSLMPNLQLSEQDAADIAAWIISVPAAWPVTVEVPDVDSKEVREGIDALLTLYVAKGGFTREGKHTAVPLSEVDSFVAGLSANDKLMFLGEKTISRLGCFGCHNIPGFENAKPIGTPLNGWGFKSPSKLDYAHIAEYVVDQKEDADGTRDGTDTYYQEKLAEHTRSGFLYQKLHRPRSYDYKKTSDDLKAWDERLRMPQFAFANDPKAIEEVMTFVLGLTGEKINAKYLPKTHYKPSQFAVAQGQKLLDRHNCAGCHVLRMPRYTVAPGSNLEDALPGFTTMVNSSYNARETDYLKEFYPALSWDSKKKPALKPDDGKPVVIEGMPIGQLEDDLTVQLWRPVTIRGYTFNVGDNITLNAKAIVKTEADGGNFAWLYAAHESERTGKNFTDYWNRLPPPLLREGLKVQTPWVTAFLKDPYPIRPAANLRMPRFHYGRDEKDSGRERTGLANYFAARDNAEFPYQEIPERTQAYLARAEKAHPDYLAGGWQLITKGACIQCHSIGQYQPTGGDQVVNGPDLRQVSSRFRPDYLAEWLANPKRLIPYTAMPQNIPPHGPPPAGVPKSFNDKPLDMVQAVRDTLLNYVDAVEHQLASSKPAPSQPSKPESSKPESSKPAPKASGASE